MEAMSVLDKKRKSLGLTERRVSDILKTSTVKERIIQIYKKLVDSRIWNVRNLPFQDSSLNTNTHSRVLY